MLVGNTPSSPVKSPHHPITPVATVTSLANQWHQPSPLQGGVNVAFWPVNIVQDESMNAGDVKELR